MAEIEAFHSKVPPQRQRRGGPLVKLAVLVALLVAVFLTLRLTPLGSYLTLEGIGEGISWLRNHPLAPVIFVIIYAVATALGGPGLVFTLAGGVLFGFFWGTIFNSIAANLGANAAFLIARGLGREGVRRLIGKDSKALRRLDEVAGRHGFRGLLTLRLIPVVPFNVLNYGSGLVSLKWRSYILATAIGILPATAIYTFFADALLQGSQEASRDALVRMLIAGALLVLLSFLPAALKRLNVRLPGMSVLATVAFLGMTGPQGAEGRQGAPGRNYLPDPQLFSQVLSSVVKHDGVDYQSLVASPHTLALYLEALEDTETSGLRMASQDEQLAFWINAYNACMLKRVVDHYPIRRAGGLLGVRNRLAGRPENSVWQIDEVFTGAHCAVAGKLRSQDEIEHKIIRPLGDPRIHFAINCAAKSCPPLTTEAYDASSLDAQLDARVLAFLADSTHFQLLESGGKRTVRVNQVLEWFQDDFGGRDGLHVFLAGYARGDALVALEEAGSDLSFIEYDWTLNDVAR